MCLAELGRLTLARSAAAASAFDRSNKPLKCEWFYSERLSGELFAARDNCAPTSTAAQESRPPLFSSTFPLVIQPSDRRPRARAPLASPVSLPLAPRALAEPVAPIDPAVGQTDKTCRAAVEGRRAARALTDWARRFALGEPDFQVLWCLRFAAERCLDQATLAGRLALSPAQVSMTVERLGANGWIACRAAPADRRRKLWQLTQPGASLLEQMLAEADRLNGFPHERATPFAGGSGSCHPSIKEAA